MSRDGTEAGQGPDQNATGVKKDDKACSSSSDKASTSTPRKRNAFSELMGPKPKQSRPNTKDIPPNSTHSPRLNPAISGLLPYIADPASFPPGTIIRETPHSILIRDIYPKSQVHLLLLPRDPAFYPLTPFEAFNPTEPANTAFLSLMRDEARMAAELAASELSRLISPHSRACQARLDTISSSDPASPLPPTRDFLPDIKVGVHAQPSMSTLHIHIISVDNYSPCLKNKKHYNSFNTKFFVSLDDFPLVEEDSLLGRAEQESLLKGDMTCWRCGENFQNKFKQLKEHLKVEFEQWRKI